MDKILRYENYISSKKVNEEYEIEEESEYKGTAYIKELAKMLGVEAIGNEIDYKGQKVNFYSETDKIHIGNEEFDTPEEAYDYLTGEMSNAGSTNMSMENEEDGQHEMNMENEEDDDMSMENEEDDQHEMNMENEEDRRMNHSEDDEEVVVEEPEYVEEYESRRNVKSFDDYFAVNEEEVFGLSKTEQTEKKKATLTSDLNKKLTAWKSKNVKCDNNKFMTDAAADGYAGAVGYDKKTNSVFYMTAKQVGETNKSGLGVGQSFA
jgi:hypothetical protein